MLRFVIIRGPAGIGKTTVSNLLASELNAICIHEDEVKSECKVEYVLGEKWIPEDKSAIVVKKIKEYVYAALGKGDSVIVEGNFYHKSLLHDLASSFSDSIIITLTASSLTCIDRDRLRSQPIGPQRVKDVYALVSAFDAGIVINTDGSTSQMVVSKIFNVLEKKVK